jgi:hypothetical protein
MSDNRISGWHVAVAAEAVAAALFARCGLDVSVQYGANQPEYDLIVARGERLLKVSVKGSQDGAWGLSQSHLKNADYIAAIEAWRQRHKPRTILCFVQFKDVTLDQLPRVYLATPSDVADRLKATAGGRGATILYESHTWGPRARSAGSAEKIPDAWRFSEYRVEQLLRGV